jgi:hypothetical protein
MELAERGDGEATGCDCGDVDRSGDEREWELHGYKSRIILQTQDDNHIWEQDANGYHWIGDKCDGDRRSVEWDCESKRTEHDILF